MARTDLKPPLPALRRLVGGRGDGLVVTCSSEGRLDVLDVAGSGPWVLSFPRTSTPDLALMNGTGRLDQVSGEVFSTDDLLRYRWDADAGVFRHLKRERVIVRSVKDVRTGEVQHEYADVDK
jgi:hypothetical protein